MHKKEFTNSSQSSKVNIDSKKDLQDELLLIISMRGIMRLYLSDKYLFVYR